MLIGVVGVGLRNAEVVNRKQADEDWQRLALKAPVSLYERFRDSGYRGAQERFAFYMLAARFEGAHVLVPESIAQRHGWHLERVSRLLLEVTPSDLPVPRLVGAEPAKSADLTGRLDRRPIYFYIDDGADYAVIETGEEGPFFWVPRRWVEPEP